MRRLFGTDGVRGVAGRFPLSASAVVRLAASAGRVLRRHVKSKKMHNVLIVRDTLLRSGALLFRPSRAGSRSAMDCGFTTAAFSARPRPRSWFGLIGFKPASSFLLRTIRPNSTASNFSIRTAANGRTRGSIFERRKAFLLQEQIGFRENSAASKKTVRRLAE